MKHMLVINRKNTAVLIFLLLATFGAISVQAVGICQPCDNDSDCDSGLTCPNGRCVGCPEDALVCNPLQACEFEDIIDKVIDFIFNVALVIAPLMILIAGFLFVTAGGDQNRTQRAKDIIIWTIVGFFILMLARGIMGVIMNLLGVSS